MDHISPTHRSPYVTLYVPLCYIYSRTSAQSLDSPPASLALEAHSADVEVHTHTTSTARAVSVKIH